jgi:diguanylate cyclase (GGDEF)-like protein
MDQRAIQRWLEASPRRALVVAAALWTVIVGIDIVTGAELTMTPFYVLPIAIAAWSCGRPSAYAMGVASGAVCCALDRLQGFPYSRLAFLYWAGAARLAFFVLVAWLMTALRRAYVRLAELALFDPLTQLYNRRAFRHLAHRELVRARRSRKPVSLIFIDLDNFKQVNDASGHAAGDDVLGRVADELRAFRASDIASRHGGDEFVVLLPESDAVASRFAAERLRADLLASMAAHGYPVTFSVGVVTSEPAPYSVDALIQRADELAYEVKRANKDGIRHEAVAGPAAEPEQRDSMAVLDDLPALSSETIPLRRVVK